MNKSFMQFKLKLNSNKSRVLCIKGWEPCFTEEAIMNIPIITEYKFLGVILNNRGSIAQHIDLINKKSNYLHSTLGKYAYKLNLNNQILLW